MLLEAHKESSFFTIQTLNKIDDVTSLCVGTGSGDKSRLRRWLEYTLPVN